MKGNALETIQGVASGVSNTVNVYPGRTLNSKPRRVHVLRFQIQGRGIVFESVRSHEMRDGDPVAVAGLPRGSLLEALAWRNTHTGARGNQPWLFWLVVGIVFGSVALLPAIGVMTGFFEGGRVRNWTALVIVLILFSGIFGLFAFIGFRVARRTLAALRALRRL